MAKRAYGHTIRHGRPVVIDETFKPRKGSLDFEGTTRRRYGLGDTIRTLRGR
jgi:hypothetical protein